MASIQPQPQPQPQPEYTTTSDPQHIAMIPVVAAALDTYSGDIPMGVPLVAPTATTRRLPPPCWTPDETSALIDAYRDKWLSLRRANLRASHWQDVAEAIHASCPHVTPPKTAVQCRHKMEKLRKRYRAELLRARSIPHHRFSSSWIYFPQMHSIDASPHNLLPLNHADVDDDDQPPPLPLPLQSQPFPAPIPDFHHHNHNNSNNYPPKHSYAPDFGAPQFNTASRFDDNAAGQPDMGTEEMNYANADTSSSDKKKKRKMMMSNGVEKRHKRGRDRDREDDDSERGEMVNAIRMLGEGFLNMEKMKMEMMRETERLRMEMDMNRTQMLLDSQLRIVKAFAKAWADIVIDTPTTDHPAS